MSGLMSVLVVSSLLNTSRHTPFPSKYFIICVSKKNSLSAALSYLGIINTSGDSVILSGYFLHPGVVM